MAQRTAEQIYMETIPMHVNGKKAAGKSHRGSIQGQWFLTNQTAFSDEMLGSMEEENC